MKCSRVAKDMWLPSTFVHRRAIGHESADRRKCTGALGAGIGKTIAVQSRICKSTSVTFYGVLQHRELTSTLCAPSRLLLEC